MAPMPPEHPNPILQACAVPYRRRDGQAEFCLITSTGQGWWGFPKGIIDPGETDIQTALNEAEEEAGLHGAIEGGPLGQFKYSKWGTELLVTAFLMRVDEEDDDWEDAAWRGRCWCRPDRARTQIYREEFRQLLEAAVERVEP